MPRNRTLLAAGVGLGLASGLQVTTLIPQHAVVTSAPSARFASVRMAEVACVEAACDSPAGIYVNDVLVSGTSLRSMTLENAQGGLARAGDIIGDEGTAVVVFLRHLG